jgi:uncharacterized protein (TIGR02246 family)
MKSDEQRIKDLIALWHVRTAEGDVDAVLSMMTEDATFLIAGHPPMTGKASFEKGLRALLAHSTIRSTSRVEEVFVSGDLGYAISLQFVEMTSKHGADHQTREGRTLTIFSRSAANTWLLKRDANLMSGGPA